MNCLEHRPERCEAHNVVLVVASTGSALQATGVLLARNPSPLLLGSQPRRGARLSDHAVADTQERTTS